jgi:molybdopterin converting factor small subunit
MIRVRLELWLRLGKDLGKDFQRISDTHSILEEEIEEGMTGRIFFNHLCENYQPIREKIFERKKGTLSPEVVVSLNDKVIDPSELYDRVLEDGDKITLLPMFAGG